MPRSRTTRVSQGILRIVSRLLAVAVFRIRCNGREFIPKTGGGLLLSNHQSNLDPWLVGLCSDRFLSYLARRTLFRFPPLGRTIAWFGAIPIDREGSGFGGVKETLRQLKQGELVLMFPEGTRTLDGEVRALKPGFCAIAKRCGLPLVPLALDGPFEAWPRHRLIPRPAVIHVQFGAPLTPEEITAMTDEELVAEVERRIRICHAQTRQGRQSADARIRSVCSSATP